MPILREPIPAPQAALLRRAVLDFRTSQHCRVFPTIVHVGSLGSDRASFIDPTHTGQPHRTGRSRYATELDLAQRADIIEVLLDRYELQLPVDPPMVWLTRPGDVGQIHDVDANWIAAARLAFGEAGLSLTLIVITRSGWYDPRSAVHRRWRRLRRTR